MTFEKTPQSLWAWLSAVSFRLLLAFFLMNLCQQFLSQFFGMIATVFFMLTALRAIHGAHFVWLESQSKLAVNTDCVKLIILGDVIRVIRWGEVDKIAIIERRSLFWPDWKGILISSSEATIRFTISDLASGECDDLLELVRNRLNQFLEQRQESGEDLAIEAFNIHLRGK